MALTMKAQLISLAAFLFSAAFANAETFTIANFTFDQASAVKTAAIVEGSSVLVDHSNKNFGRFSEDYLRSPTLMVNEFAHFDRTKTTAYLLGRAGSKGLGRHIDLASAPGTRTTLELTWGSDGLPNGKGTDFCVFESGEPTKADVYAVAVRKAGSTEFTPFRFKGSARYDRLHLVFATEFDLSDFGFADGEVCSAVRIRTIWGASNKAGPDKVNYESGEGMIIPPSHPDYKNAFPIRIKPGGSEISTDQLDPDIIYVAGKYPLVPLKTQAQQEVPAEKKEDVAGKK
jgi:hypothetical protein